MTDYSLWEVIKNGNKVLKRTVGETKQEYEPTTVEEKQDKKNEMKARGSLLMALLNKDQLKFHSHKDAKLLMEAIEKRYRGNKESKKVQRTLLKKQYENFARSSSEIMDQTFNSTNSNSSTNEADNTAYGVSTAYTQSNPASGDNLSDAVICAFLASQPNSPQLAQEDLEQIDPDDLEEMDLQWEMAMLTIRARRFIKRTGRKLDVNGQRVGFDRTKVECYNCHKYGHFARECKAPRNQENRGREINRRTMTVETPTKNALVAQDGIGGYDWSYQAEEEHPTNFALMAHTSSGSSSSSDSEEYNKSKSDKGYHAVPLPFTGNFIPRKPDLTFMDKIVESENMDVTTIVTPSNVKTVESNLESAGVKSNGDAVEPKTVRKNNFRPPVIEDWNLMMKVRSGKINTAGASVNTAVRLVNTVGSKLTVNHSRSISNSYKRVKDTIARDRAVVSENKGKWVNVVKASACWVWKAKNSSASNTFKKYSYIDWLLKAHDWKQMLSYDGGFVSFGDGKGRISGKGKIKTRTLDFDNVYFCKELKYNLFSMSQICDKKNNVLFTDTECLVLSSDFKLLDESQVLLRVPRKDNIYSVDLKSVVPTKGLTCLFAKATIDESNLWHRRLGYINFKNMNKLVRGNLVFFLATKNETSGILKTFITEIENQLDHKVKVIRCDNRTEFKNSVMNQFYEMKGIKREFNVAMTPQQDGVAERRNRTLIEATRTMLVDSKLPTTFLAEVVNTACYVLNRVLIIKPHNKTPYELICRRPPLIHFMKPFGCPVTILNSRDHLGKFEGKADEGFFVGYSVVSKAMRVFNKRTSIVEETLNIRFLENTPNVIGNGPDWLFDVDSLTISINYVPVVAGNQTNGIAGTRDNIVTGQAEKKKEPDQEYILIPFCTTDPLISQDPKVSEKDAEEKPTKMDESGASDKDGKDDQATRSEFERLLQQVKQTVHPNSTNGINTVSTPISAAGPSCTDDDPSSPVNAAEASNTFEEHLFKRFSPFKNAFSLPPVSNVTPMDDTGIFGNAYDDEDVGAEADLNNLETTMNVSPIPTTRIDKDHPKDQIIRDFNLTIQTRRMTKISDEHVMELLQFQLQKVWTLVNLPNGKRAIGTKWVFRNKNDERGIVVRNKARLVAQGYTQEEGINYDEVFAHVARIEAIRLFFAYASFMVFIVYQMDVKSALLYGTIDEEVYVCQPPSFEDPQFPDKVYKVEKALYGLHQAPRAWYKTLSTYLIENGFRRGTIDKTLFIKKGKGAILLVQVYVDDIIFRSTKKSLCNEFEDGIFISKDKYVADILKKFDFAIVKTTSTPMEPNKELIKDEEADSMDVHLYTSMIGSLMYLTASRPDIMFAVCACARDSPFDLEAFSDSDNVGASVDRKSTIGGCQFLSKRLISWQCKKQTIVVNSTTEAEYVAAANCYGQNPVFHSKTKHIETRHHFIRDCYEKKLIQMKGQDNPLIPNPHPHLLNSTIMKPIIVPSSYQPKKTYKPWTAIRTTEISQSSRPINLVVDEIVYKEWEDIMERAVTTASILDAE
ncbi:putative ribonuclease H-like domain-containing protein [Tanacetum coccineum]